MLKTMDRVKEARMRRLIQSNLSSAYRLFQEYKKQALNNKEQKQNFNTIRRAIYFEHDTGFDLSDLIDAQAKIQMTESNIHNLGCQLSNQLAVATNYLAELIINSIEEERSLNIYEQYMGQLQTLVADMKSCVLDISAIIAPVTRLHVFLCNFPIKKLNLIRNCEQIIESI